MASSLEELLAEEGFKGSRRIARTRSSLQSNPVTKPHYSIIDQEKRLSVSDDRIRAERTKSYASQCRIGDNRDTAQSWRPRDNLAERDKLDEGLKNENVEKSSSNTKLSKNHDSKTSARIPRKEIIEVGEQKDNRVKDIYSNELLIANRGKEKDFIDFRYREKWHGTLVKDAKLDKRHGSSSSTLMVGQLSGNTRKNIKQQDRSRSRSISGSFENSYNKKHGLATQTPADLALDEVAVQAVVSILNGYIKRFLKDEDFRTTIHHNCFSSLNFIELEDENGTETKVIRSLEQAIDTIEEAAKESVSQKELKRTSLQLSIITGLSLNDLKYGITCGIPNYKLSACAHLYLSVVYKIQRKDKISAKHLLQVFCDSPSQARTTLLPELWEYLFSPHLSHLKAWYNREVHILVDMPSKTRKIKHLEKVYNEHLDSGTYSFAVYYKDWLTEGAEAPSVPSVTIPSISALESRLGSSLGHSSELASSVDSFSPQPMVSKKLYDSVFGSSSKAGVEEEEEHTMEDNLESCMRHSHGSSIAEQKLTFVSEVVKYTDEDTEEDFNKMTLAIERHTKGTSMIDEQKWQGKSVSDDIPYSFTRVESNMLDDLWHERTRNEESVSSSVVNPTETSSSPKGLYFPTVPQEFVCPLTGTLFREPTTLETGQTFERAAIKAWFEKGKKTCPVSGNSLHCGALPFTNLVLKRLIDNWKSEQFSHVLDFASQIVGKESHKLKHDAASVFNLESLFTSLDGVNKTNYVKQLISIGLLSFLFRRFELGNAEEKTHVLALLLHCSEADSSCMHQIARNIDKKCLLDLLQSKDVAPRTSTISLLTELFSLKRNDVISFLNGFSGADILNTMNALLLYLDSSLHQKPLVAVLLLHLDLLVCSQ
ncbi:putative E3 ubiquitin-protein ligase LIN [Prosopis cineraria]|uniref:putative E3 ubiquitin-protein ligase LIN n=1 Tax=Prosopis cineraria TaxID=364024 RepID=UPI0024104A47|nr:putative E3 ubiquitin-protein ligase LIN [Prosopis cineraria]